MFFIISPVRVCPTFKADLILSLFSFSNNTNYYHLNHFLKICHVEWHDTNTNTIITAMRSKSIISISKWMQNHQKQFNVFLTNLYKPIVSTSIKFELKNLNLKLKACKKWKWIDYISNSLKKHLVLECDANGYLAFDLIFYIK